jgi:hypothetical protein
MQKPPHSPETKKIRPESFYSAISTLYFSGEQIVKRKMSRPNDASGDQACVSDFR